MRHFFARFAVPKVRNRTIRAQFCAVFFSFERFLKMRCAGMRGFSGASETVWGSKTLLSAEVREIQSRRYNQHVWQTKLVYFIHVLGGGPKLRERVSCKNEREMTNWGSSNEESMTKA